MDGGESPRVIPKTNEPVNSAVRFLNRRPVYDYIINSELQLQLDDEVATGQVSRRALVPDDTTVGTYTDNPVLNLIVYEVEFLDVKLK